MRIRIFLMLVIGIGQGRITNNLGTFVNDIDDALHIADAKSISMVYEMLDSEGIYIGASSALNVVAGFEMAQKLGPGELIYKYHLNTSHACVLSRRAHCRNGSL